MRPKELIEKWVDIFIEGNSTKIAEFYHEDAINHQVTNRPVVGKNAIEKMFVYEFRQADITCIIENGKKKFQRGYWDKLSFLR